MALAQATIRIGQTEIVGVSDGILKTSLDGVGGLPRAVVQQLTGQSEDVFIPVNNFLIDVGDRRILIDAGSGRDMQPTLGELPDNLRRAGVDPAGITHILLTHLHPDHANGLIDQDGAANFPNAELVVHGTEAGFWLRPAEGPEAAPVARNRARTAHNVAPYLQRLRRVRDGEEVQGFTPFLAPGHTPGHTCWRFGDGHSSVMFWGDVVHLSAVQIAHPEAWMAFDLDREVAARSRQRLLDIAATEHCIIAGAHVAAPGFGHVVRRGTSYAFEPVA